MNAHEQYAEDLALYALGTLQGGERFALERHLQACAHCRTELERLRGDMALLAVSTSGPRPPARSKARLLAAIAAEPRRPPVPAHKRRAWWTALEWAATAAAVAIILLLVHQNSRLERQIGDLQADSASQARQLTEAKQLLTTLSSPDAARYVLVAGNTPPQPQGRAIYVASSGTLVFLASNMPKLPSQKVYELWLIPTHGAPIPAGVFRPDHEGSGAIVKPPLPAGVEAKTFAITVEPEGGSAAPTTTPSMVGAPG